MAALKFFYGSPWKILIRENGPERKKVDHHWSRKMRNWTQVQCSKLSFQCSKMHNSSIIPFHTPCMSYLVYLSSSAFFPLLCHQHRNISISQLRNIDSTESDSLHTLHGFLYHKLTIQVKEHR